jgi:hypothetical protein
MHLPREKITAAIGALHAAEHALLAIESADAQNSVIAGRCAVAAVYLETAMKLDIDDAYEALKLVAERVSLPSGVRAVVDAALVKAGLGRSESVRHIRIVGDGL